MGKKISGSKKSLWTHLGGNYPFHSWAKRVTMHFEEFLHQLRDNAQSLNTRKLHYFFLILNLFF